MSVPYCPYCRSEESEFTSIKQRIEEISREDNQQQDKETKTVGNNLFLKEFVREGHQLEDELPYHYCDYLELVDWSGRVIRDDKLGVIDNRLPPILTRLGIDPEQWHKAMQPKGVHHFGRAMGRCDALREQAKRLSIKWIKGITLSCKLFPT